MHTLADELRRCLMPCETTTRCRQGEHETLRSPAGTERGNIWGSERAAARHREEESDVAVPLESTTPVPASRWLHFVCDDVVSHEVLSSPEPRRHAVPRACVRSHSPDALQSPRVLSVTWMGLGSVDYGDDGFGIRLAERLQEMGVPSVRVIGVWLDRCLMLSQIPEHIVFLDAIDAGEEPGTLFWLNSKAMRQRWPQITTHRLSLGLLAQYLEERWPLRVWLLGAQPLHLQAGAGLSQPVVRALEEAATAIASIVMTRHLREVLAA